MDVLEHMKYRLENPVVQDGVPRRDVVEIHGSDWKNLRLATLSCGHHRLVPADMVPMTAKCMQCA